MVKFRTSEEMEARRAFIESADRENIIKHHEPILSFSDLKNLKNDELVDRLEEIEDQALIIKWRILWELRKRFKSDKLFGQYIAELKATRAICVGNSTQDINRSIHAGKFCTQHNITNLLSVGLSQSSVYILSRPINESVANDVYIKIKNKNLPIKEVERFVEQAKAVSTIKQTNKINEIDYEQKNEKEEIIESISLEHLKFKSEITVLNNDNTKQKSSHEHRMEILSRLPPLDGETTKDDILKEIEVIRLFYNEVMSNLMY